jgi:hypothetical protein
LLLTYTTKFGRVSSSTRSAAPADLHQPLLLLLFDITSFGLISTVSAGQCDNAFEFLEWQYWSVERS